MAHGAVLISGCSTGIGRATALHLDAQGFTVYAGVRKESDAEALRKEGSERLQTLQLDVTDPQAIRAAAESLGTELGDQGLAGLVNNAGISVNGPLEFIPLDELRRQLEVNTVSVVAMSQAFLPLIRKARGRLVHIGSIGGRNATPMLGPYSASKFALEAIAEAQRRELGPWGIEVVLIEPGAIKSAIWEKGLSDSEQMLANGSPRELELYRPGMEALQKAAVKLAASAIPALEVAKVVEKALLLRRPRPRYVVGPDAKVQALLARLLPDRLRDAFVLRFINYPRQAR